MALAASSRITRFGCERADWRVVHFQLRAVHICETPFRNSVLRSIAAPTWRFRRVVALRDENHLDAGDSSIGFRLRIYRGCALLQSMTNVEQLSRGFPWAEPLQGKDLEVEFVGSDVQITGRFPLYEAKESPCDLLRQYEKSPKLVAIGQQTDRNAVA